MMNWIGILSAIVQLMAIVEPIFGPKSGAVKKEVVTGAVKTIVDVVEEVSAGGQKQTWERIKEPVSNIIDNAATILFPK